MVVGEKKAKNSFFRFLLEFNKKQKKPFCFSQINIAKGQLGQILISKLGYCQVFLKDKNKYDLNQFLAVAFVRFMHLYIFTMPSPVCRWRDWHTRDNFWSLRITNMTIVSIM